MISDYYLLVDYFVFEITFTYLQLLFSPLFIMADGPEWCLIESDPGVFTELIRNFGVSGAQVEELYTLDDEAFAELKPVHGLIFLFKWRPGDEPSGKLDVENKNNIFFAQQVISNACATQAIVNLLLNVKSDDIKLGPILEEFKSFTSDFDPAVSLFQGCSGTHDYENYFRTAAFVLATPNLFVLLIIALLVNNCLSWMFVDLEKKTTSILLLICRSMDISMNLMGFNLPQSIWAPSRKEKNGFRPFVP